MLSRSVVVLWILQAFSTTLYAQIGQITLTLIDTSRNNRPIPTDIFYPAVSTGTQTQIAPGTFPVVVCGHGFLMTTTAYYNLRDALVPEGYIVAFPNTEGSFTPNHADFGKDLQYVVQHIQAHGAGSTIPIDRVATTSAIMGHSMGGGSAFLASQNNTHITTLITYAAANTNPSAIAAAAQVSVPTLLFSGTHDCITPPAQHQDPMYDSCTADFKTQIYVKGGGHCYFANANFSCSFGEATCSLSPTITREQQQDVTHDFVKMWLAYYLKSDCASGLAFQDSLTQSQRIEFRQSQDISCTIATEDHMAYPADIEVQPNPCTTYLRVTRSAEPLYRIDIYTTTQHLIWSTEETPTVNTVVVDCQHFPPGIYFLRVNHRNWYRFVKQ